jgi:hypothetical protein
MQEKCEVYAKKETTQKLDLKSKKPEQYAMNFSISLHSNPQGILSRKH